jgi:TRAP-type C4-dicarboxylate transport system substrate-binding protein
MYKILSILIAFVGLQISVSAQKSEVYYFKADLPCCQARACNSIEEEVKQIVTAKGGEVEFKVVRLSDPANKELVDKYNAKSQTVVILSKNKKKEKVVDASDVVRQYARSGNKDQFEKDLLARVNDSKK